MSFYDKIVEIVVSKIGVNLSLAKITKKVYILLITARVTFVLFLFTNELEYMYI